MNQNEHKNSFKSSQKKIQRNTPHSEFSNDQIFGKKSFRKNSKAEIKGLATEPVSRKNSPQVQDRKYHVKSGFMSQRKLIKTRQKQQADIDAKSVRSIFQRRVNSQSKVSKTSVSQLGQGKQMSQKSKINFAKKIIEDLRKETFKLKRNNGLRYTENSKPSRSMQIAKNVQNRQEQLKKSMQKLKPSFNINEVKFFSSKKSETKTQNKQVSKINFSAIKRENSPSKIRQKLFQTSKTAQQSSKTLAKMLKKVVEPLQSYKDHISGSVTPSSQYFINLSFMSQYINLCKKDDMINQIDFNSLRLMQNIYVCLIEVFTHYGSSKSGQNKKEFDSFEMVKEYAGVYLQNYSKLKFEFILCQVLFKPLKKKLAPFFVFQRIIFYWIVDRCLQHYMSQDSINLVGSFLKNSHQLLMTIINMISESLSNAKASQDALIDTFKTLRMTRQLDKKLPVLKDLWLQINEKTLSKSIKQGQEDDSMNTMTQLLASYDKQENPDITILFKLQQYFNWLQLYIPPLFFLPSSPSKPFSLVIDLDGTLIYYNEQTRILKYRPYMDRFLLAMQKYFQLIIFSSHAKERTDIIVKEIQRDDRIFAYRLNKSHMVFQEGVLRKNVGYLGRNLQRLVFVDDEEKNTNWLPSNSFRIKAFNGDKQDKQLLHLTDWLSTLMEQKPTDIRGKLKKPQHVLQQIVEIDQISSTIQPSIEYLQTEQQKTHKKRN